MIGGLGGCEIRRFRFDSFHLLLPCVNQGWYFITNSDQLNSEFTDSVGYFKCIKHEEHAATEVLEGIGGFRIAPVPPNLPTIESLEEVEVIE